MHIPAWCCHATDCVLVAKHKLALVLPGSRPQGLVLTKCRQLLAIRQLMLLAIPGAWARGCAHLPTAAGAALADTHLKNPVESGGWSVELRTAGTRRQLRAQ